MRCMREHVWFITVVCSCKRSARSAERPRMLGAYVSRPRIAQNSKSIAVNFADDPLLLTVFRGYGFHHPDDRAAQGGILDLDEGLHQREPIGGGEKIGDIGRR